MHNMPVDAEAFMVSKASRIVQNSEALRRSHYDPPAPHPMAKRRFDRDDLLGIGDEIKRQIQYGNDTLLKAYGFSIAGIEYFLETRLGLDADKATLMAHALSNLWSTRNDR